MQLRCYHCHRPFALSNEAVHNALNVLTKENLGHYNAQCPHCRRVNRVSQQELHHAAPDWKPEEAEEAPPENPVE